MPSDDNIRAMCVSCDGATSGTFRATKDSGAASQGERVAREEDGMKVRDILQEEAQRNWNRWVRRAEARRYLARMRRSARDQVRRVWGECIAAGMADNEVWALLNSPQGMEWRRELREGAVHRTRGGAEVDGRALEGMLRAIEEARAARDRAKRAEALVRDGVALRHALPEPPGAVRRLVRVSGYPDKRRAKRREP